MFQFLNLHVPLYGQSTANLHPSIRYRQENILTCAIWVGQSKPKMDIIFAPILQDLNHMNVVGFKFHSPEGHLTVRLKLLFGVYDLIAKAQVLNIKQFNGYYGCPTCLHPGENHEVHVYPPEFYSLRTNDSFQRAIDAGINSGAIVQGVKGLSPFQGYIDLVNGFPLDYMHCTLEGVVKWLFCRWTESKYSGEPYSIRSSLREVDQSLLKQKPPHAFCRPPRSIRSHLSYWKASEYRYWLLVYSLPLLVNILPSLYFHHFSLLVTSIHLLLQESLTETMCDSAEEMLSVCCCQNFMV